MAIALTSVEIQAMIVVPVIFYLLNLLWRRYHYWPMPDGLYAESDWYKKEHNVAATVPTNEPEDPHAHMGGLPSHTIKKKGHVHNPGDERQAGRQYEGSWLSSFDIVFTVIMACMLGGLIGVTIIFEPELLHNREFWKMNLFKLGIMCGISIFGGLVCRGMLPIDEFGYIRTPIFAKMAKKKMAFMSLAELREGLRQIGKNPKQAELFLGRHDADRDGRISQEEFVGLAEEVGYKKTWFKVNYTRKLQHFAAYAIPLLIHTNVAGSAQLHLVWGDFFTLLGFLVQIKPLRESFTPFMLMFNSLDRPEDRPMCLKWIIAGNVLPGLCLIVFFDWLFSRFGLEQQQLVMIFVLVAGVGDGLAEPVGIYFGKHKYATRSCTSTEKYTRSYEGSSCVFITTILFVEMYYWGFNTAFQMWLLVAILPITMTIAEATSPHTMDTPLLMGLGGTIIYIVLRWV